MLADTPLRGSYRADLRHVTTPPSRQFIASMLKLRWCEGGVMLTHSTLICASLASLRVFSM